VSSGKVNDPKDDSVRQRIDRFEISARVCAYLGAGYGGVILLIGAIGAPPDWAWWIRSVTVTFVLLGVASLGRAYIDFIQQSAQLNRRVDRGETLPTAPAEPINRYPRMTLNFYRASILGLIASGVGVGVQAWLHC
jgi:hypothetical protein